MDGKKAVVEAGPTLDVRHRIQYPMRKRLAFAFAAATLSAAAQQPTLLRNTTVIDGTGVSAREHMDVTFAAGLIESIAPTSSTTPQGVTIIDCSGKTLIPGLISAHSHLGVLEANATPSATAYNLPNVTAALNQFERYGVTTIVSLGLNRDLVYELRAQQRSGTLGGATILTAGRGIGVPGGAPPLMVAKDQVDLPTTADQARADVDTFAARHADIVKIWVDPLHNKAPEMQPSIYEAVIDQAHKDRLHVAAHEYALKDAQSLVDDGIDVLAHSVRDQAVDAAFISSMLRHHTWYIPTLELDEAFYLYAREPSIMQSEFFKQAAGTQLLAKLTASDYAAKTLADKDTKQHQQDHALALQNFKTLYDAGVHVAFGTDSGAVPGRIPGFSEHRELEDLVLSGLTPLEAITVATGSTGELLHTLDPTITVGLIAPGYSADLILLTADPLTDIHNTRHIAAIYHHGRPVPNPAPQD
jgi:imidazolonepropionase-like amidohydrolase